MKRLLLLPILAAVLVAGCGGGDDNSGDSTNAAATVPSSEEAMKKDDAMKGDAMKKDDAAMKGEAMKGDDAMKAEASMKPAGTKVKVVGSEFGRVVADRKGEALYLFDREDNGKSECYGACAKAWPPLLTKGKPRAIAGANPKLLGTTKRRNGKLQVTYAGQPLYYYVHDAPGTILCHDVPEFGGTWLVVKPNGKAAA